MHSRYSYPSRQSPLGCLIPARATFARVTAPSIESCGAGALPGVSRHAGRCPIAALAGIGQPCGTIPLRSRSQLWSRQGGTLSAAHGVAPLQGRRSARLRWSLKPWTTPPPRYVAPIAAGRYKATADQRSPRPDWGASRAPHLDPGDVHHRRAPARVTATPVRETASERTRGPRSPLTITRTWRTAQRRGEASMPADGSAARPCAATECRTRRSSS